MDVLVVKEKGLKWGSLNSYCISLICGDCRMRPTTGPWPSRSKEPRLAVLEGLGPLLRFHRLLRAPGAELEQLLGWRKNFHTFPRPGRWDFCLISSAAIAYLQKSLGGFTINSLPSREECAGGVKALIILGIVIRACQTQFLARVSLQSSLRDWSFSP